MNQETKKSIEQNKNQLLFDTNFIPRINLAGKVFVPQSNCHFPRQVNEYILYFVTRGKMQIYDENQLLLLEPGDCHIFTPGTYQHGKNTPSMVEYFYLHFDMSNSSIGASGRSSSPTGNSSIHNSDADDHCEDFICIPKHFHLDENSQRHLAHELENMYHHFKDNSPHQNLDNAYLFMHIILELEALTLNYDSKNSGESYLVTEIKNYIHVNFASDLTSNSFSEYFGLSYDHLNRLYKKDTGYTIFDYLGSYRIEMSKTLLHSGMLTLCQIADSVGYNNEFYFSKVFKKYTGMSPREYRKL